MSCSPNTLLSDGKDFQRLSEREQLIATAQLVCDITQAGGAFAVVLANGSVYGPNGVVDTSATTTNGIQEAINSLETVSSIDAVGGGKVVLGPGVFTMTTKVTIPNTWPFKLVLEGAGEQRTIIIYNGATNTACFVCAVVSPAGTTRMLRLEVSGCTFTRVDNSTNFLWNVTGCNRVEFHHNTFVHYEALTAGNGHYTLSCEQDVPTAPPGTAGIGIEFTTDSSTNGQEFISIWNNFFYGLAAGIFNGGVRGDIRGNTFMDIGGYWDGATWHYNSTAWTGNYNNVATQQKAALSTGACILNEAQFGVLLIIGNQFLSSGAAIYADTANGGLTLGGPIHLVGNSYESMKYRVLTWDDTLANIASYEMGLSGAAGYLSNGFPPDSVVTASATVISPTGVSPVALGGVTGLKIIQNTGHIQVQGVLDSWDMARVTTSDATTTGQSLVDVTGLSLALVSNAVYEIEAVLSVATTAVTTGTKYGVQYSVAGGAVEAQIIASSTATATESERISALNTATSAFLTTSGETGQALIKGIVTTGANAGNLTIQHLKVTSGTSTVKVNSFLKVRRIA